MKREREQERQIYVNNFLVHSSKKSSSQSYVISGFKFYFLKCLN